VAHLAVRVPEDWFSSECDHSSCRTPAFRHDSDWRAHYAARVLAGDSKNLPPKIIAYVLEGQSIDIRPAPVERDWMDASDQRYAYRCLPLNIANAHGWEILCPSGFTAAWNGLPHLDAIHIIPDAGTNPPAVSHFGGGILTFHLPCLFRTNAGFDLIAQGPVNRPKDGISALSGIIETDWAPYTFTMNWIFTRPGLIWFEPGEPICHIYPYRRGELESFEPELLQLSEAPDLKQEYEAWMKSRNSFNSELKQTGSQAQEERWQKRYYRGVDMAGQQGTPDHRTRLRLKPFARR
jgi:hypothetical protein